MIVGFTGTQQGMTVLQKVMFVGVLARLGPEEFHHGDCIGADADAHAIVRREWPKCRIVIHPPDIDAKRAWCTGDFYCKIKSYIARNYDIVAVCEELVAAPKHRVEELRSGTWSTVRAARRAGKLVHMVWP